PDPTIPHAPPNRPSSDLGLEQKENIMPHNLTATRSVTVDAPPERIWEALTDPAQVKQYMWGAELVSDWRQGSPIVYRGVWEGKRDRKSTRLNSSHVKNSY